ncbi:MAG: UDP-glucose 6-dehydrogenase [Alphaproteobacteria bacterium CG_4_10_14_0_2_um_filter_63_37]|nr:MAG: UDP-glucose 6-dehydrogenase [Proteobacteria bacterium CG1_02_64_396]PJA23777.1 MAG: UDP-glucose 6-dehydrogenase [Alphaproteobacteria bacterium CG_4_10_14_0_2_um_filter_63_37]
MRIAVVGTGYVGLVTGTCLADLGHRVACIDIDPRKIEGLKQGQIPIYEPGLDDLVRRNAKAGRLSFTTDYEEGLTGAEVVFIAVGTPPGEDGSADLQYVLAVAKKIAEVIDHDAVIVDKSTVPVGTADQVRAVLTQTLEARDSSLSLTVVSNPEFLKEGAAVEDFMRPDRVVVGADEPESRLVMERLYAPLVRNGHPVLVMDVRSAEMTKYAANAMLATRISFMNEIALLCERLGADVEMVRRGIGTDRRIGMPFLYAGVGYGGSCFPKDVQALVHMMSDAGLPGAVVNAVEAANKAQRQWFIERIAVTLESLHGKKIAVWGLAFKPNTDDLREAPAFDVIRALLDGGAQVAAYDPVAVPGFRREGFEHPNLTLVEEEGYAALESADALVLLTEWKEFQVPDRDRMAALMNDKLVFDGRNQYDPWEWAAEGWRVLGIGRPQIEPEFLP